MTETGIKQFSSISLSDDGQSVLIQTELESGMAVGLRVQCGHAEWLAKSVLILSDQARDRQMVSGRARPVADDILRATSLRVLGKSQDRNTLIEAIGTWLSNGSDGMTFVLINAQLARYLAEDLGEFLRLATSISDP